MFDCCIRVMSRLSERLLAGIDYEEAIRRRRANYQACMRCWGVTICSSGSPRGSDAIRLSLFAFPSG